MPSAAAEDAPPRPTSDYGRSRYAQERLIDYFCRTRGGRGIHVRYAHTNTVEAGAVRRIAEKVLQGRSLGDNPETRLQVIALEDAVRMTHRALEHVACPPTAVNCCHPRVWTRRELAEEIHRRLGRGEVVFDAPFGGEDRSAYADTRRMIEWFAPPQVPVEIVIGRVCDAMGTS